MNRFVILSGCSGGGKSTLLAEMAARGHATIAEPGRRIVTEELAGDGRALPWNDLAAFAERAVALALADLQRAQTMSGWVFFDRSLIDAVAAHIRATGKAPHALNLSEHGYHNRVFLTPPWPELYATDAERQHGLDAAVEEYEHLRRLFPQLGYRIDILPKIGIRERADYVQQHLAAD